MIIMFSGQLYNELINKLMSMQVHSVVSANLKFYMLRNK